MSRRKSNVGDWATLISSLHGAYADSQMRQMDVALGQLKIESQKEENALQRQHDFDLLSFKQEASNANRMQDRIDAPENARFRKYTMQDGVSSLDQEATVAAIDEHAFYASKGANIGSPTFTKANEYYGMEDVTPGYTTEEDILVLDEMLKDEYMGSDYNRDDVHDDYLRSMGILEAGETYVGGITMGPDDQMQGISAVNKEGLSRRYSAFKEGIRQNENIYKTEAGYGSFVQANVQDDLTLQSALFQTEESKALKSSVANLPTTLKHLLGPDVYELKEDDGKQYYEIEDSEYVASSALSGILSGSDPSAELDRILTLKTDNPVEYNDFLSKLENEGEAIYNAVRGAVTNRQRLLRYEASEKQAVEDAIAGKSIRRRSNVMQKLQEGKADNKFMDSMKEYEKELRFAMNVYSSEEDIDKAVFSLNEKYDNNNQLPWPVRKSIMEAINKESE